MEKNDFSGLRRVLALNSDFSFFSLCEDDVGKKSASLIQPACPSLYPFLYSISLVVSMKQT